MANTQNANAKDAKTTKSASTKDAQWGRSKDVKYCQGRVTVSLGTLPAGVSWG